MGCGPQQQWLTVWQRHTPAEGAPSLDLGDTGQAKESQYSCRGVAGVQLNLGTGGCVSALGLLALSIAPKCIVLDEAPE